MMPLLLTQEFRVEPARTARTQGTSAWDYDAILEGLLSGNLSGQPMDPQDAQLLLTLLEDLGWVPDAGQLAGALPYFAHNLDIGTLRALMRNLGYSCSRRKARGKNMPRDRFAGVILWRDDRLWALSAEEPRQRRLMRPRAGNKQPEHRPVQRNSLYDLVVFSPVTQQSAKPRPAVLPSFSFETFARLAPDLRLALFLTLLSGCITVAFSVTVIFLFDLIVSGQQPQVIAAVIVASGALFLFDMLFRSMKSRLLGRAAGRFEFLLGSALFDKLLRLPRRMIDQAPIGEQTLRVRELESMKDFFAGPFAILALELPVTVILIAAIAIFSPILALLLVCVILAFLIASLCLAPSLVSRASALSNARGNLSRMQRELIAKRAVIARNGLAWPWSNRADLAINSVINARLRLARATSGQEALCYCCMPVAAGSVMFAGAELVIAGSLTGGKLVAATMLTWRAIAPVQQGLLILPKTGDMLRLFRQIDAMMRFPEEENQSNLGKAAPEDADLSANNIFLRAPNANMPVLSGAELKIPHGLMVSVTGASGSGKSALLSVLSGQVQPQAGSVRLGGVNLSELSNHSLGRRIVLVSQRPVLIYGSLAQNLRFVDPLISDARVEELLKEVGLAPLLSRLPKGMHSRLDPTVDVTLISGGVRTAVAVAQALLIEPSVLLIDEASEDVDPMIDAALLAALARRRGRMTSLFVTHRPSTIRACDAVVTVADGQTRLAVHNIEKDMAV